MTCEKRRRAVDAAFKGVVAPPRIRRSHVRILWVVVVVIAVLIVVGVIVR
jgi:hypothetical protein